MSLYKQLLILISFIFFIIFSVNLVLSLNNIRTYLEVESKLHVQNTATSLGLSLSPYIKDENDPIIRTMMNAVFDMGYYREMRLVDVDGQPLVVLENTNKVSDVPQWLIDLMPMKVATAETEISSGWSISGTLSVSTNPGYGYLKLYKQGTETLTFSLLIFLGAISLLMLVLRFTLQSLKGIESQANDIALGKFTVIDKLPWTLEVKNVAMSMNAMSIKLGKMIARLNARLEALTENLKHDPLTSLFNQETFKNDLRQALFSDNSGYVALIKLDDLTEITNHLGNENANSLLQDFARQLKDLTSQNVTAYRLYGSEFALLFSPFDNEKIIDFSQNMQQKITNLGQDYDIDDLAHTGIIHFDKSSDFKKLFLAMREAYEQATNIGPNAYFIQEQSTSAMAKLEWKETITNVIDNDMPEITMTSEAFNYAFTPERKVMQEAFTVVRDRQKTPLSVGTFFSMAREFALEEHLDKCIINKIISQMEIQQQNVPVTINLSINSITSATFTSWLRERLSKTSISTNLLVFSVTAYLVAKDLDGFANFSLFAHSLGAKTLIKRYSSDVVPLVLLKQLHVDYIRLARELTTNIAGNKAKSDLLDILQEVTELLNIKIIAEGVSNQDDFTLVKDSGIYGIGR